MFTQVFLDNPFVTPSKNGNRKVVDEKNLNAVAPINQPRLITARHPLGC